MREAALEALERAREHLERIGFERLGVLGGHIKKKPRTKTGLFRDGKEPSGLRRLDRHGRLALRTVLGELDLAGREREERVVLANADVRAGVEPRAALANDDRARVHELAAECLDAEALA